MTGKVRSLLFLIPPLYLAAGFLNIHLALAGLVCMALPFLFLLKNRRKSWCQGLCPRMRFLQKFRRSRFVLPLPARLTGKGVRDGVVIYFGVNLFFILMSTVMVILGRIGPIDRVRFLILFQINRELPQLMAGPAVPPWLLHFSFRIYSMMFTSMVIGTVLALLFRPAAWCRVCPVGTLSDDLLKKIRQN